MLRTGTAAIALVLIEEDMGCLWLKLTVDDRLAHMLPIKSRLGALSWCDSFSRRFVKVNKSMSEEDTEESFSVITENAE